MCTTGYNQIQSLRLGLEIMPISNSIRYINKNFTNRILIHFAGKPHSPFSILYHTGRKSGKIYVIPIIAHRTKDGFLFVLTYGPQVDWVKNILKTRSAELCWHGVVFLLTTPHYIAPQNARRVFPLPVRWMLSILRVDQFLEMNASLI